MEKARTDALYYALKEKGYPDDFCREIAYKQMNTDYTATRMLGYLYRVSNPRPEDVVDEMLAILSDRNAIIQKKELEHAPTAAPPAAPPAAEDKAVHLFKRKGAPPKAAVLLKIILDNIGKTT